MTDNVVVQLKQPERRETVWSNEPAKVLHPAFGGSRPTLVSAIAPTQVELFPEVKLPWLAGKGYPLLDLNTGTAFGVRL